MSNSLSAKSGSGKAGPISNVVCPGCKRSLDDVIESMIRQRGKFKAQREAARKEAAQWKANHDSQLAKKRALHERHEELHEAVRQFIGVYMADGDSGPAVARLKDLTRGQQNGI